MWIELHSVTDKATDDLKKSTKFIKRVIDATRKTLGVEEDPRGVKVFNGLSASSKGEHAFVNIHYDHATEGAKDYAHKFHAAAVEAIKTTPVDEPKPEKPAETETATEVAEEKAAEVTA
jgi:hypothetical protein